MSPCKSLLCLLVVVVQHSAEQVQSPPAETARQGRKEHLPLCHSGRKPAGFSGMAGMNTFQGWAGYTVYDKTCRIIREEKAGLCGISGKTYRISGKKNPIQSNPILLLRYRTCLQYTNFQRRKSYGYYINWLFFYLATDISLSKIRSDKKNKLT